MAAPTESAAASGPTPAPIERSGGADTREDRPPELLGPGELRPVARGQVDVIDVADLRELLRARMPLLHPLPEHRTREFARDDGDGHVVATLVGELLPVARDMHGRRDRALAERRAQLVVEVDQLLLPEERPVRQRDLAVLCRELVVDDLTIAERFAGDVDDAGDTVGPRVDRSMGDRAAAGVPDEYHLAVGRVEGVDHLDNRIDVVTQSDLGALGVFRLHTGQRERMRAVPRLLEGGNDLVPRRAVEPETGNQNDNHG